MDSPDMRDDIEQFHLNRDKILLDDAGYSDSDSIDGLSEEETEVLPLMDEEEEEDDDEEEEEEDDEANQYYINEDSEGDGSDGQLATRAWGSSKKVFYSQQEIGLSSSDEAEDFEEREAIELQDKMASTLSETDFLTLQALGEPMDENNNLEQVHVDLSKLAEEDKLKLLEKTSPELTPLIESLRISLTLVTTLQQTGMDGQMSKLNELKVHVHYCYCINAMFYLLLKSSKETTQSHPVFSRLLSLKQLISQLETIQPTLIVKQKGSKANVVDDVTMSTEHAQWDPLEYYQAVKKGKSKKKRVVFEEPQPDVEFLDDEGKKRPISYQISRNKGLTPRRSKEQRNPRVKHRKKFKKALQKRKGQVLPVITEMNRYAGEATGIRSGVSRSVKIK